jgi:ABC-type glycerol-3-phosphate transport system substrate-binding protein
MRITRITAVAACAVALAAPAGCSHGDSSGNSAGAVTVNWWTWDPNQAAAYEQCIPAFTKANPNIKVKISQYKVSDYFTKLTAGFVSGDAPDAFMNSVTFLQSYASQGQLMALDKDIDRDHLDLKQYSIGTSAWKYKDGKQYALPMDWATGVLYYNQDLLTKAGFTQKDADNLTWSADDGGTFWKMIKHLTVDESGVHGDEPGFNPAKVKTYGLGNIESTGDPFGQNEWGWLLPNDGINIPDKNQWATVFNYADPKVVKALQLVRTLTNDGFSPKLNQFTTAGTEQLGSGNVAMLVGGTWDSSTFAALPNIKVGVAPLPAGSSGKRALMTNANGNNIWAGTKHPDQTWKWVSYQESEACQTTAAVYNGSFFPSIAASMDALGKQQSAKVSDFSVFTDYVKNDELFPAPVYNNGAALANAMVPQFESYFTNKADESIFAKMQAQSKELLAQAK